METMEWTNIDRSKWPSGPWDGEPDTVQWTDEATGLPCLARRHERSGHWCGYVGISKGHRAFEKPYDDVNVDVHGGLTFASFCDGEPGTGICHLPEQGEPERVWWLGFDCRHYLDYCPMDKIFERDYASEGALFRVEADHQYRTLNYVKKQCARLAHQLLAM